MGLSTVSILTASFQVGGGIDQSRIVAQKIGQGIKHGISSFRLLRSGSVLTVLFPLIVAQKIGSGIKKGITGSDQSQF